MADLGFITGQIAGLSNQSDRRIFEEIFKHLLREQRFGEPAAQTKALNFAAVYQTSTATGSTGEFSIQHGMGTTPRLGIPVINLNQPGSQSGGLEVSRVADGKRVYLKTTAGAGAAVWLLIE